MTDVGAVGDGFILDMVDWLVPSVNYFRLLCVCKRMNYSFC